MTGKATRDILADPDFRVLSSRKLTISAALALAECLLFFGFVALVAWHREFLALRIGGSAVTLGIPIAVGVIVLSWMLTGIYVRWANTACDALVARIRGKIGA